VVVTPARIATTHLPLSISSGRVSMGIVAPADLSAEALAEFAPAHQRLPYRSIWRPALSNDPIVQ
jgi:hypothetical protein